VFEYYVDIEESMQVATDEFDNYCW